MSITKDSYCLSKCPEEKREQAAKIANHLTIAINALADAQFECDGHKNPNKETMNPYSRLDGLALTLYGKRVELSNYLASVLNGNTY